PCAMIAPPVRPGSLRASGRSAPIRTALAAEEPDVTDDVVPAHRFPAGHPRGRTAGFALPDPGRRTVPPRWAGRLEDYAGRAGPNRRWRSPRPHRRAAGAAGPTFAQRTRPQRGVNV